MPEFRWILIGLGILLIAYVYLRGRLETRRESDLSDANKDPSGPDTSLYRRLAESPAQRREPSLGGMTAPVTEQSGVTTEREHRSGSEEQPSSVDTVAGSPVVANSSQSPAKQPNPARKIDQASNAPEKIISLRVAVRRTDASGHAIVDALRKEGLEFGQFGIFHRLAMDGETATRSTVFSVANMVEPGTFDLERDEDWGCPGLALFMVLPGPRNGVAAFTDMLATARRLAEAVEADILDEKGSTVTRQTADHIREEIIQFEHRTRIAGY